MAESDIHPMVVDLEKKLFVIAGHGCRGILHSLKVKDTPSTFTIPDNTIIINFNTYGTISASTDSLIFMQQIYNINRPLFNYIIDPDNYIQNLDRKNIKSYRHKDFFTNPLHLIYSKYNPISNIDIYVSGMTYYNGYLDWNTDKGATHLHGIYEFNTMPVKQKGLSTLEKSIYKIYTENSKFFNIIFVFSCRLIEYKLGNFFDVMPDINSIKYFGNMSLINYFESNTLNKIFDILKDAINNILADGDVSYNINIKNIRLNIPDGYVSQNKFINMILIKLNLSEHNKNDLLFYIRHIFNDYNIFEQIYIYIDEQNAESWYKKIFKLKYQEPIYNFDTYDDIILYLGRNLLYQLVKNIYEVINKNQEILEEQHGFLSPISEYYKFNIYENIKNLLNIKIIKINIKDTQILFEDGNALFFLDLFLKTKTGNLSSSSSDSKSSKTLK